MKHLKLLLLAVFIGSFSLNAASKMKKFRPSMLEVTVTNKKPKTRGSYIDEKIQNIESIVKIRNKNNFSVHSMEMHYVVIGKSVTNSKEYNILLNKSASIKLKAKEKVTILSESVSTEYDDRHSYQYGFKYDGYLLVIKDPKGNEFIVKTTNSKLKKKISKVLNMDADEEFSM